MQFNARIATILAAMAVSVSGAAVTPAAEPADSFVAQASQVDGHVFMCTDAQWHGSCTNLAFSDNRCVNFPSGFQNDVSSIGPDEGWVCLIHRDLSCGGVSIIIESPGYSDLSIFTDGWNDIVKSVQCHRA